MFIIYIGLSGCVRKKVGEVRCLWRVVGSFDGEKGIFVVRGYSCRNCGFRERWWLGGVKRKCCRGG